MRCRAGDARRQRRQRVKLRLAIGRFSTDSVVTVNERSPLCDWMSGASAWTVTVSDSAADFEGQRPDADPIAGADRDAVRLSVLKPSIVTLMV